MLIYLTMVEGDMILWIVYFPYHLPYISCTIQCCVHYPSIKPYTSISIAQVWYHTVWEVISSLCHYYNVFLLTTQLTLVRLLDEVREVCPAHVVQCTGDIAVIYKFSIDSVLRRFCFQKISFQDVQVVYVQRWLLSKRLGVKDGMKFQCITI